MDRAGRTLPATLLLPCLVTMLSLAGCRTGPKSFASVNDPSPLNRARAIGMGEGQPEAVAVPALIARLSDPDPVVRLAANEALKKRAGEDFGYQPYREPEDQADAIAKWRGWWQARQGNAPIRTAETVSRKRGLRRGVRR